MDDLETSHRAEDPRRARPALLLIVVPPHLPSRVHYFTSMLAGSGIEIIVDRRHAERRRSSGRHTEDRRHGDRRDSHRLFAYVCGCQVVPMGQPVVS